jgi:Rod binding domain-containing protein
VKTALHQLVVRVQKVLEQQETALGVFLDIEGVFTNTSYDSMRAALLKMGLTTPSYSGLELPWRAAWLRRLSVDLPRGLRYLEAAHREVFCRRSYCALFLI